MRIVTSSDYLSYNIRWHPVVHASTRGISDQTCDTHLIHLFRLANNPTRHIPFCQHPPTFTNASNTPRIRLHTFLPVRRFSNVCPDGTLRSNHVLSLRLPRVVVPCQFRFQCYAIPALLCSRTTSSSPFHFNPQRYSRQRYSSRRHRLFVPTD